MNKKPREQMFLEALMIVGKPPTVIKYDPYEDGSINPKWMHGITAYQNWAMGFDTLMFERYGVSMHTAYKLRGKFLRWLKEQRRD